MAKHMSAGQSTERNAGTNEITLDHGRDCGGRAEGVGRVVDAEEHHPTQSRWPVVLDIVRKCRAHVVRQRQNFSPDVIC